MITNMIRISLCLLTLPHLMAMEIDHINTPFNQLPKLPIEVWQKTGEAGGILTPKDALAFQSSCRAAQVNIYHRNAGIALMNGASTMNPCVFNFKFYLTPYEIISRHLMPHVLYNFASEALRITYDAMGWGHSHKKKVQAAQKAGILSVGLILENIDVYELKDLLPLFATIKKIKLDLPSPNTFKNIFPTNEHIQALADLGILDTLCEIEVESAKYLTSNCIEFLEQYFDIYVTKEITHFTIIMDRSIVAKRKTHPL